MILVGEDVVVDCDIDLIGVMRGRDVTVDVTWFQDRDPVRPDSRVIISGATGDVGGVHSSLTFSPVHFSDMDTYECRVTLTPLLGPASPVSSSASIFLNITGLRVLNLNCSSFLPSYLEPVDPVRPEDITFREVESDSVIIQWTVSHISYSPETYVVQYGTSRESLIHNSSRTHSEEDRVTYSVQLSGLRDNTTYYVQVLATNTAQRSSRSSVESFTTMEIVSGIHSYIHKNEHSLHSFMIIIIVPPASVRLRKSPNMILVGEDVVVYCDIDLIGVMRGRDVTVDVTWFQDRDPVRPDSRVIISGATGDVGGVHSSLTFSPVHFSDMDTYECRVTLTPLLGTASPVSSSAFIFLNITGLRVIKVLNSFQVSFHSI